MLSQAAFGHAPFTRLLNGSERLLRVRKTVHHYFLAEFVIISPVSCGEELLNLIKVSLESIKRSPLRRHSILNLTSIILILHLLQERGDLVWPPLKWLLRYILQKLLIVDHTPRRMLPAVGVLLVVIQNGMLLGAANSSDQTHEICFVFQRNLTEIVACCF